MYLNEARIIDLAPTAYKIIHDHVALKPDEELMLVVDTESIMPMAYALAFVAYAQGSDYTIAMMPSREKGHGYFPERVDKLPRAINEAYRAADVVIGLTRGSFSPSTNPLQTELVFNQKSLRYLSMAFRDLECFTRGAGLADYQKIKDECVRLRGIMEQHKRIRVQSALGTDFTAEMPIRADSPLFEGPYVRIETGLAPVPGTEGAFPDGEVFFAPRQATANGVLVVDGPIEYVGVPKTPIRVYVEDGYIKKIEGDCYEASVLREVIAKNEAADFIGEVAVGMNPNSLVNGNVQEEKKSLGSVHIGFGVARQFKNTYLEFIPKKIHADMVIRNAVVSLDDTLIIKENKLLV